MRRTQILTGLFLLIFAASFASGTTRAPAAAGSFYPADSATLARLVKEHLDRVAGSPQIDGRIIALIIPHAGLVYSGQIAAQAYKLLEQTQVNRVILCGPSHKYGFDGLSVYGSGVVWETPLGRVSCDDELCRQLVEYDRNITSLAEAHLREHCLEVQLPYLMTVLGKFRIVPIVMGYPTPATIDLLADALETITPDPHTVLIASTDWQHYRPAAEGWPMDSLAIDCLDSLDTDRLAHYLQSGQVEACGGGSAVAVLKAAQAMGANRVKLLRYGDSGDVTGDKSSVVSYIAAVVYAVEDTAADSATPPATGSTKENPHEKYGLSEANRALLLSIARQSIAEYLTDGTMPEFTVPDNLRQPGAAFVTLEKKGKLRGCIGHTVADQPLYKTISICAVQAAVADYRFQPLTQEELDEVSIEISVLTPLEEVKMLSEIEVGRDGLMISMGGKRGLLLPQVAEEYGWDRNQFLRQTCLKAGLPTDAYKSPHARIEKFQAVIFHEE